MQMCPKCSRDNRDDDLFCGECGTPQVGLLGRGTVLQGRYRLDAVLESGTTQTSYRAVDLRLGGQTIVVKENRDLTPAGQEQFATLANELAASDQPDVSRAIDYFAELSGRQYLVMTPAPGPGLTSLAATLPLTPEPAAGQISIPAGSPTPSAARVSPVRPVVVGAPRSARRPMMAGLAALLVVVVLVVAPCAMGVGLPYCPQSRAVETAGMGSLAIDVVTPSPIVVLVVVTTTPLPVMPTDMPLPPPTLPPASPMPVPSVTPTRTPTLAGVTGQIVFHSERDGNFEIYIMDADGSDQRRLTDDPANDVFASLSPDGQLIAFVSDRGGNENIYVMGTDGQNLRQLTFDPKSDNLPVWSPDRRRIAFNSDRGGIRQIYVMNADGSDQQPVTDVPERCGHPAWSPSGDEIAFNRGELDAATEIYVVNLASGELRRLTGNTWLDWSPSWSPDGLHLLFLSKRPDNADVYAMGLQGESQQLMYGGSGYEWGAVWSPNGQWIAFTSDKDGENEIYVMPTAGGEPTRLTYHGGAYPGWSQ
jgi:dipeptidyl aminopeptidase/acylaminoacyl peptidase